MPKKGSEIVDVEVTLVYQTAKAWLVRSHNTAKQAWIPKSVGELDIDARPMSLALPTYYAQDKELL